MKIRKDAIDYSMPDWKSRLEVRFKAKVEICDASGCWNWIGSLDSKGYGNLKSRPYVYRAHRLSAFLFHPTFNKSLDVCHKCDNPKCVNPEHLFQGTESENMRDCLNKGRGRQKNTVSRVKEILRLRTLGTKRKEIAAQFGISVPMVDHIIYRQNWKWI